jgi:hypothetical protein
MAYSSADLAQGTVKKFPKHFQMKHILFYHHQDQPFRFTLVTDGVELEVELIKEGSHGSPGDGSWYTELTVCPVKTLETMKGTRIVHIDVDPFGDATYY